MAYDYIIKAGATSQIIDVMLRSSSTGAGVTGVAHTDVTASYLRPGGTRTAITLAAGTAGDAYSSGKWAEVDATNTPGLYQFHIPDAAIAAGVIGSTLFFKGASFISVVKKVVLVAYDPQDATALGISRIDATVSSRSTYAGGDTAGTTTLLSRIIGTLAAGTHNPQSGDTYARLGAPAGASVSADVAAVNAKTTNLPATPAATGDAMTLTAAYDAAKTAAQAGDAMALTAGERTTLAAALWNALTSGLSTVGSIGKLLVDNINATISSRLASASYTAPLDAAATATAVQTGMTAQGYDSTRADALDLLDTTITGVPAAVWGAGTRTLTSGAAPSAADNAAAVWDLAIAGHTTAGSTGEKLNAAGASGDFLASAVPGAYADGTAGAALGNIPAIKAKTDLLAAATAPEIRAGITSGGDVYLYLGADHSADDMAWVFTDAGDWPDLTGLTVVLNVRKTDSTLLQLTPTITGEGTANQVIRAEPTAAQTAGFTIGRKSYAVWVTDGGGNTRPIFSGDVLVENLPH